jgi:hypothetical protein
MLRFLVFLSASALMTACGGKVIGEMGDSGSADDGEGLDDSPHIGPATNPLDGTWLYTDRVGDESFTARITFQSDGALTESVEVSDCTGVDTVSGLSWTSTSTTLTVTGTESCTGELTCGTSTAGCSTLSPMGPATDTTCDYVVSNDGDTLTLSDCNAAGGGSSRAVLTRD